jgi:hypothetical protein
LADTRGAILRPGFVGNASVPSTPMLEDVMDDTRTPSRQGPALPWAVAVQSARRRLDA